MAMQATHVATFVNADIELRQRRKDAKPETKRVMAAVNDAKDAALAAMLAAGRSVVRVNGSTWVVLVEKRGSFPKLSVDTLTETLRCMDPVAADGGGAGGGADGAYGVASDVCVGVRDYVRKSLSYRGDGFVSLVVQCHPPSGHVSAASEMKGVECVSEMAEAARVAQVSNAETGLGADEDGCLYAAAVYVEALSARNIHLDRLRVECAPVISRRNDTEAAVIEYVAPNGGDVGVPLYRRVDCSVTGAQLYIKVDFRRRKKSVSRSAFLQTVDNELRSRLALERTAAVVVSDTWLAGLRSKLESTFGSFIEAGGVPDVTARVSVSSSVPPCLRQQPA
jgi:hypothetical protein